MSFIAYSLGKDQLLIEQLHFLIWKELQVFPLVRQFLDRIDNPKFDAEGRQPLRLGFQDREIS